uniref:Uncharacterized protein n=1 Tax=Cacopsylla melanoneura TaxID=428564 RepID=A0A8D8XEP0_9HEMI
MLPNVIVPKIREVPRSVLSIGMVIIKLYIYLLLGTLYKMHFEVISQRCETIFYFIGISKIHFKTFFSNAFPKHVLFPSYSIIPKPCFVWSIIILRSQRVIL